MQTNKESKNLEHLSHGMSITLMVYKGQLEKL